MKIKNLYTCNDNGIKPGKPHILICIFILSPMFWQIYSANFSLHDKQIFRQTPGIVTQNGNYFLAFQYGPNSNYFYCGSKIVKGNLVFFLDVTTSTGNPDGRWQYEAIKNKQKIALVEKGKAYWEQPDHQLIKLEIKVLESGEIIVPVQRHKH